MTAPAQPSGCWHCCVVWCTDCIYSLQVIDEFMTAVTQRWPKAVVQFEDFQLSVAYPLLQRYRKSHLVFNDDIQASA